MLEDLFEALKKECKKSFIRAKHPVMVLNPVVQFDRSYVLFIIPVNQAKSQCGGIMVPVDEFTSLAEVTTAPIEIP